MTRYRAYCVASGIEGTRFVMQGARFFGPDRPFEEPWDVSVPADPLEERATALRLEQERQERENAAWLEARRAGRLAS